MMGLDEKSREIMYVLDESDRGRVSTTEARQKTGYSNRAVNYRWSKLADHGLVEIEYDSTLTQEGVAPMKIGVLTDDGRQALDEGLSVTAQPDLADTDARIDYLESRIDTLETKQTDTRNDLAGLIDFVNNRVMPTINRAEDTLNIYDDE